MEPTGEVDQQRWGKKENGTLFSHNESKIMPSGGKWIQPEIIILGELSQTNAAHFFLTWRTEMAAGRLHCSPPYFGVCVCEGSHRTRGSLPQLSWLTCELLRVACLCLPVLGSKTVQLCPASYVGAGELNSGLHCCAASALSH